MCRKLYIVLLLCVAMLTPSIASAQDISLYEKQKVAIASIIDKNDRHINSKLKEYILNGIRDAFVNSKDYEVFNVNIDDIRNELKAKNIPPSFSNICKEVGQIAEAEFIIFTEISVTSSSFGNAGSQNAEIIITSSQFRIATGSQVATNVVTTQPNVQSIQSGTAQLMSKLFGVKMAGYSNSQSSYNNSQSSSSSRNAYNNSSYSSQSGYGQSSSYQQSTYKTYKVGDYYDVGGKQGVVFAVTSDGRHGKIVSLTDLGCMNWDAAMTKCRSLGAGWHLSTKDELLAIYKIKFVINATLSAVGDRIDTRLYWSSTICDSSRAWRVYMSNGDTYGSAKIYDYYVRAVSAF